MRNAEGLRPFRRQRMEWGDVVWLYDAGSWDIGSPMVGFGVTPPMKSEPRHFHFGFRQIVFVVEGHGEQHSEGRVTQLSPGLIVHNPQGCEYRTINTGDQPLKRLVINIPSMADLYRAALALRSSLHATQQTGPEAQEPQNTLARLLGVPVSVVDSEARPITTPTGRTTFCDSLCRDPDQANRCSSVIRSLINASLETGHPAVASCCPGVMMMAAGCLTPMGSVGVLCGPMFLNRATRRSKEHISSLADRLGMDRGSLLQAYTEIPEIQKTRAYVVMEVLSTISSHTPLLTATTRQHKVAGYWPSSPGDMENLLKEVELKLLLAQISPHFLFNALNALAGLSVVENATRTLGAISCLSDLIRSMMQPVQPVTSLARDVEFARKYFAVQRMRFGDGIGIRVAVEPSASSASIPALTLQPLVENAVLHGLVPRNAQGQVLISGKRSGKTVRIVVSDDGAGFSTKQRPQGLSHEMGMGLGLVKRRLRCLFDKDFRMTVRSKVGAGTTVTITVPYRRWCANGTRVRGSDS